MSKRLREEDDDEPGVVNEAKKLLLDSEAEPNNDELNHGQLDNDIALRDLWLEKESKSDEQKYLKVIKLEKNDMNLSLPDGWIGSCHQSGAIVYLHRPTRVCTWGRPYHLGEGSVRRHDVPSVAIPCLQQKKATGKLATIFDHGTRESQTVGNGTCINNDHLSSSGGNGHSCACKITDNSQIAEKDGDNAKDIGQHSTSDQHSDDHSGGATNTVCDDTTNDKLTSTKPSENKDEIDLIKTSEFSAYLAKLWQFEEICKDDEKRIIEGKSEQKVELDSQTLSTIPYLVDGISIRRKPEGFILNPIGKSPQSLLNEYCSKKLKVKPVYKVKESGDAKKPFLATVEIDGLQYGCGLASNKKQARHVAAQKTLDIFVPGTFEQILDIEQYLKLFDNVPIENPNVYNLTTKLGLMMPYQLLTQCHQRNQGVLTSKIKCQMYQAEDKKLYFSIECGKYYVEVACKNKKEGRELAAQALLKKLHPHLENWGSLLRIYMDKHTMLENTKINEIIDEPEIPEHEINHGLLSDLKHDMWQLLKKRKSQSSNTNSGKFTDIKI